MSLPDMIPDINYGKKLLLKGIQMAPNDLAVLKAITQAIIVCKKKVIYISFNKYFLLHSNCYVFLITIFYLDI